MYEFSHKYKALADEIIRDNPDLSFIGDIPVAFLSCDKKKLSHGHEVQGECIKISEMYRILSDYAFCIVVYEPCCVGFSDLQFKILIEHELRHVGLKRNKFFIVPHDYEHGEFDAIINKYGEHWDC